jgi:pimeloyl-ACP methyl ester carboxylesterase
MEQPVDLVGHDVGALITLRVATAFDVPLRSFVVDVAPIFHPSFVWSERVHKLQTPGVGEDLLKGMREANPEDPDSTAARLANAGVPIEEAQAMGAAHDETMSRSILDFYRSAVPKRGRRLVERHRRPKPLARAGSAAAGPTRGREDVPGGGSAARRSESTSR